MSNSINWTPEIPCREEVVNVIRFIKDRLEAKGIAYEMEQADPNPNVFSFISMDGAGRANLGFVSWCENPDRVGYAAFDPARAKHDEMEGVPEEESACWWVPKDAEMMAMHLDGTVRQVVLADLAEKWSAADLAEKMKNKE